MFEKLHHKLQGVNLHLVGVKIVAEFPSNANVQDDKH